MGCVWWRKKMCTHAKHRAYICVPIYVVSICKILTQLNVTYLYATRTYTTCIRTLLKNIPINLCVLLINTVWLIINSVHGKPEKIRSLGTYSINDVIACSAFYILCSGNIIIPVCVKILPPPIQWYNILMNGSEFSENVSLKKTNLGEFIWKNVGIYNLRNELYFQTNFFLYICIYSIYYKYPSQIYTIKTWKCD